PCMSVHHHLPHLLLLLFFFLLSLRPSTSTLFPYTTLFRSQLAWSIGPAITFLLAVTVAPMGLSGSRLIFLHLFIIAGVKKSNVKDRKSTRLNSSHVSISYAVFCLKKKTK